MGTVVLRPTSQGTCQLTPYGHANNYENVNEVTLETSDYNYCGVTDSASDTFGFNSTGLTTETINQIVFYFNGTSLSSTSGITQYNCMYLGGEWYLGSAKTISQFQTSATETFATNPATGNAWTVSELDSLVAAYALYVPALSTGGRARQFYITVTYAVTPPDAPTNVTASTDQIADVIVSWTKSAGATGYRVYDGVVNISGLLGDVDHYHDNRSKPSITPGTTVASQGESSNYTNLSLTGNSISNGVSVTYTVKAEISGVQSVASNSATGYGLADSVTYQWRVSAGDSDGSYSDINGATTAIYKYTMDKNIGRYFKCVQNSTGANQDISAARRGFTLGIPTTRCFAAIY